MLVTYATAHSWLKPVVSEVFSSFGKNARAKLRSTLEHYKEHGIRLEIAPVHEDFLTKFIPIYEGSIEQRRNPRVGNIRKKISRKGRKYYYLAVYENENLRGATMFSVRKNRLSIAFRMYERDWLKATLQASPALLAEYEMDRFASTQGVTTIIHGRDKNPYGRNSEIGVAIFKLSVGCAPVKSNTYEIQNLETDTVSEDILLFDYPHDTETRITRAYLITQKATEEKWLQATKYPTKLEIVTIYRP